MCHCMCHCIRHAPITSLDSTLLMCRLGMHLLATHASFNNACMFQEEMHDKMRLSTTLRHTSTHDMPRHRCMQGMPRHKARCASRESACTRHVEQQDRSETQEAADCRLQAPTAGRCCLGRRVRLKGWLVRRALATIQGWLVRPAPARRHADQANTPTTRSTQPKRGCYPRAHTLPPRQSLPRRNCTREVKTREVKTRQVTTRQVTTQDR